MTIIVVEGVVQQENVVDAQAAAQQTACHLVKLSSGFGRGLGEVLSLNFFEKVFVAAGLLYCDGSDGHTSGCHRR